MKVFSQMFRRMISVSKQVFILSGIAVVFGLYSLILFRRLAFFETEISQLNNAKSKLEVALAQLQVENLERSRRLTAKDGELFPIASRPSEDDENDDIGVAGEHVRSSIINTRLPAYTHWHDDQIIVYNRVPKTGSTSFAGVAYDLCRHNRFHVLRINVTRNHHVFSMTDQARFVYNVTHWQAKRPALYHGHVAHIDFKKFGERAPIYINLLRDPLERLVSYYYFLRYGDDFIPNKKRRKSGDKRSFDDCIAEGDEDCSMEIMWKQIPFFCGMAAECWVPGSQWALDVAKQNLVREYLVVGVMEEMADFLAVLEEILPRFFKGATEKFASGGKSHLRKTNLKIAPSQITVAKIQESNIWRLENEFYLFAKEQFRFIKAHLFTDKNDILEAKRQEFSFEKIRPR